MGCCCYFGQKWCITVRSYRIMGELKSTLIQTWRRPRLFFLSPAQRVHMHFVHMCVWEECLKRVWRELCGWVSLLSIYLPDPDHFFRSFIVSMSLNGQQHHQQWMHTEKFEDFLAGCLQKLVIFKQFGIVQKFSSLKSRNNREIWRRSPD